MWRTPFVLADSVRISNMNDLDFQKKIRWSFCFGHNSSQMHVCLDNAHVNKRATHHHTPRRLSTCRTAMQEQRRSWSREKSKLWFDFYGFVVATARRASNKQTVQSLKSDSFNQNNNGRKKELLSRSLVGSQLRKKFNSVFCGWRFTIFAHDLTRYLLPGIGTHVSNYHPPGPFSGRSGRTQQNTTQHNSREILEGILWQ